MRSALTVFLALISVVWFLPQARATVSSDSVIYTNIFVNNASSDAVSFFLADKHCVYVAPENVDIAQGQVVMISITFKAHDSNGDTCYSDTDHKVEYEAVTDGSKFAIKQQAASNDNYCLDWQFFAFFYIGTAVCPRHSGAIMTAQNSPTQGFGTVCPAGVPACPPTDDSDKTMTFGFLYTGGLGVAPSGGGASPVPVGGPFKILALLVGLAGIAAWQMRRRN